MTDHDYLDHQSPKPHVKVAPPQRTAEYLETVILELTMQIAKLEAENEHLIIKIAKYTNIEQANILDPHHKVHSHAHGREKAKG